MTRRGLVPAVVALALAGALPAGCAKKETVPTDPESLKQAAEEINRMSQKEKVNKKDQKAESGE